MTTNLSNDKRIRVALVITELNVGGAERCLTQLALGLDRARFEPLVIAIAPRPVAAQQALVNQLDEAHIPVQFLNAASKWHVLLAARRLRKTLVAFGPDVVQSFLFHADVLTRVARRGSRYPSFLGLRVADPSRHRQRLERWASQTAAAVVCVSESVRQYARDTVKIAAEKLVVIPNAVNVEMQRAATPLDLTTVGVPRSRQVILCVARLHRQKGLDWLLQTMPAVFQQLPNHDLLIVGSGPEESLLREQAQALRIAERVHFVGWRSDVPRLMAASSQLVLPSRWEGLPNAVLEAMAAGLPIVASDTHGVRELLAPNDEGQLVQFGDSAALTQRLASFGLDVERAGLVGAANQARAASHFSPEALADAYQSLYESHLGRGSGFPG